METAETHFRFAENLKKVNEAVSDNEDLIRAWGKSGIHDLNELDPEDAKKIGEVVQAVQDMFGEEVDTDWVQAHFEDILKLANGDMSVYDDLLEDYMDLIVKDLDIDLDKVDLGELEYEFKVEDEGKVRDQINSFLDNLNVDTLQVGAEIDVNKEGFLATIGQLVDSGAMKREDIENMFGSYGFKVDWVDEETPRNG